MGAIRVSGWGQARARLLALAAGLRDHRGVVERAAEKVAAQTQVVAAKVLGRHTETGTAAGALVVERRGGLVTLSDLAYVSFHKWWPWRSGMPPFVMRYAAKVFAAELLAAVGRGDSSAQALAAEIVDAADAKEKERATRREERAYERREKAREKREGR
jgi:hypothetical protein